MRHSTSIRGIVRLLVGWLVSPSCWNGCRRQHQSCLLFILTSHFIHYHIHVRLGRIEFGIGLTEHGIDLTELGIGLRIYVSSHLTPYHH